MSGLEIVGLVASIMNVTEVVASLYRMVEAVQDLSHTFRDVAHRLPLIRDTLRAIERRIAQRRISSTSCTAIKVMLESCRDKVERLRDALHKFEPLKGDGNRRGGNGWLGSRYRKYRLGLHMLVGNGRQEVKLLMESLLQDVQLLAGNWALRSATEAQVGELRASLWELRGLQPKPRFAATFPQHCSKELQSRQSGQFCGSGSGSNSNGIRQYFNTNGGTQYVGRDMTFTTFTAPSRPATRDGQGWEWHDVEGSRARLPLRLIKDGSNVGSLLLSNVHLWKRPPGLITGH